MELHRHAGEAFRRDRARGKRQTEATLPVALSGSCPKAPGSAGGYLPRARGEAAKNPRPAVAQSMSSFSITRFSTRATQSALNQAGSDQILFLRGPPLSHSQPIVLRERVSNTFLPNSAKYKELVGKNTPTSTKYITGLPAAGQNRNTMMVVASAAVHEWRHITSLGVRQPPARETSNDAD